MFGLHQAVFTSSSGKNTIVYAVIKVFALNQTHLAFKICSGDGIVAYVTMIGYDVNKGHALL